MESQSLLREFVARGERLLRYGRGNARFYFRLCQASWNLSDWRRCLRYGRLTLALDPVQPKAVAFLLSAYKESQAFDRGAAFGERWIQAHGARGDTARHLAILYGDNDRFAEALAAARRGLKENPGDARLASVVAYYLARTEGGESAVRFAEPHRAAFARDPYCDSTFGEGLKAAHAWPQAEAVFRDILRRRPDDSEAFWKLLHALIEMGRPAEALGAFAGWQAKYLVTAPIANEHGRALVEAGRADEALEWIARASELAPSNEIYANNLVVILGRAGRHQECITKGRARLEQCAPGNRCAVLRSVGIAHAWLGEHREALEYYQRAFREFPAEPRPQADVLAGLNHLDRHREAIEFADGLRKEGRVLPSREFWSELAWARHQVGDFEAEGAAAAELQRLAPDDAEGLRLMLRSLQARKQTAEATTQARAWTAAHPGNAWGWRHLAEQLHESGESAEEIAAAESAQRLAADDPDFADFRVIVLRRRGRSDEALAFGRQWIAAHAGLASPTLINRIGLAADDLRDWPAAESFYRQAHEAQPAGPIWFGNLLRAKISGGRPAEAVALGGPWTVRHGLAVYVAENLAWAHRELRQFKEESELLGQALPLEPDNEPLAFGLFTSLIVQNRTADAETLLRQLERDHRATSRFFNNWANHLQDVSRRAEAEAAYHQAIQLKPDNDVAAANLASMLAHGGRAAEAAAYCRDWLARRPDDRRVRQELANALYLAEDYAAALAEFRPLAEREPDSCFLAGRIAACLRLTGESEAAHALVERWLAGRTGDAFLYNELGLAARNLGRFGDAVLHFGRALEIDPSSAVAAQQKMLALARAQRLADAVQFGDGWTAANPDKTNATFWNELGILFDDAGQLSEAERRFRRALEGDKASATIAGNLVDVVSRDHRPDEAIRLAAEFLARGAPNEYLLRRLATAHSLNHDPFSAFDQLARADALAPHADDVAFAYLDIAEEARETENGLEFGRRWLEREHNQCSGRIWAKLSRLLYQQGEVAQAIETLDKARALDPDEISHVRQLFGFFNGSSSWSRAVETFAELREEWKRDARILRQVSEAYLDLGIEGEALDLARRAAELHPEDGNAAAWVSTVQRKTGSPDAAAATAAAWQEKHGKHAAVLLARAVLELERKDFPAALATAEDAAKLDEADEEILAARVRALRGLARGDEARALLHHWIEHHDSTALISRLLDEGRPDFR